MRKFSTNDIVPLTALGAMAVIAFGSAIGAVRDGGADRPALARMVPVPVQRAALRDSASLEDSGEFAVGAVEAPSPAQAHSVMARVDAQRFPKGLILAHPSLPLGGWARITDLATGRNLAARVVERPRPADGDAQVTLSADLARGLGAVDGTSVAVLVEPLSGSPARSPLMAAHLTYDADRIVTGSITRDIQPALPEAATASRMLVFGEFDHEADAQALRDRLQAQGLGDGRFGEACVEFMLSAEGPRWRVILGPIVGWESGLEARRVAREAGYAMAELQRL